MWKYAAWKISDLNAYNVHLYDIVEKVKLWGQKTGY